MLVKGYSGEQVERHYVLGQPVDAVDMERALQFIDTRIAGRAAAGAVLAVNPEKVITLNRSSFLSDFFSKAALLIPDGIGVVFALRLRGSKVSRVPGADLMQRCCALAADKGYTVYLYGAKEDVSKRAADTLAVRYPGLRIVGRRNGYVKDDEQDSFVEEINASGAQILFVALGSPRQEEWMSRHMGRLHHVSIVQGVGGTLDTIAGSVKRAPVFWQRMHLEWFYRLLKQPSRAPRQLKLFKFVFDVLMDELRRRVSR